MKKLLKMLLGIHVHEWDKWEIEEVTIEHFFRGSPHAVLSTTQKHVQVRRCKICGLRQMQDIKLEQRIDKGS